MGRKKKDLPILDNFEITGVAAEGKSFGRWNDMIVFVPFGAPGDIVTLKITRKKHNFAEGVILEITNPSPMRTQPVCCHFTICGGCKWQHLPYPEQLNFKQQQVVDALDHIGKVPHPEVRRIIGSKQTLEYRNKLEFTFSDRGWLTESQLQSGQDFNERRALGFHIPQGFDKVLDIERCYLQDDISNQIRLFIREYCKQNDYSFFNIRSNQGLMRTIMIRTTSTGQIMLVVVFGEDNPEVITDVMQAIHNQFPQITSLQYVVNLKLNDSLQDQEFILYHGQGYIEERMDDLRFKIGPKSFYQTNSEQAHRLYQVAKDFAQLTGNELVYDLYTGTGTIANFVARDANRVVGIEYVQEAIDDAKINSRNNGIENTLFYAGDMKDVLTNDFVAQHGIPDVMIVDPPRAGMHEDVVNVILNATPKRIVYVSCNPATQARDLSKLCSKYTIEAIQPVDMFPHTHHVENVVALTLK